MFVTEALWSGKDRPAFEIIILWAISTDTSFFKLGWVFRGGAAKLHWVNRGRITRSHSSKFCKFPVVTDKAGECYLETSVCILSCCFPLLGWIYFDGYKCVIAKSFYFSRSFFIFRCAYTSVSVILISDFPIISSAGSWSRPRLGNFIDFYFLSCFCTEGWPDVLFLISFIFTLH